MRRIAMAAALAAVMPSCGSALHSAADSYAGYGKHELAVLYLAAHYRATSGAEDAKVELIRGIESAFGSLDADYASAKAAGRYSEALAVATRKEDMVLLARGLGLGEFAAVDAGRLVAEALPRAAKQAVRAVDEAESGGRSAHDQVPLLRAALALDPHNAELAARYERLRGGLQLRIVARTDCTDRFAEACRLFAERLLAKVTEERREFATIVPEGAEVENAQLVVHVNWSGADSGWKRVQSGTAKKKIDKLNRFKEPKKDAQGKKVQEVVTARYKIFERSSRATVNARVEVHELGPNKATLFSARRSESSKDDRTYVTWTGDERALGGLAAPGTDQTPPPTPEQLAHVASMKLADALAGQILAKLERGGT